MFKYNFSDQVIEKLRTYYEDNIKGKGNYSLSVEKFPVIEDKGFLTFVGFLMEHHPLNLKLELFHIVNGNGLFTPKLDLAICTVNFQTDDILDINLEKISKGLTEKATVYVTENSPYKFKGKTYENMEVIYLDGFSKSEATHVEGNFRGKPVTRQDIGIHHSLALDNSIQQARHHHHLLLLDADFISFISPENLIIEMENAQLDILGAPYGRKSQHNDVARKEEPAINMLPVCFYTLINLKTVDFDDIVMNHNMTNGMDYVPEHSGEDKPYSKHVIDTAYPFRQNIHKYRWDHFDVCLSPSCSECNRWVSPELYGLGRPLEKLYYMSIPMGLHLHYKDVGSPDLSILRDLNPYLYVESHNNFLGV